jgi:hypothetical protein
VIAALFVATGGTYYGLDDVDPWDIQRDARLYAGPHPVVAHPPCQLWVNLAAVNWKRYQRELPAWYAGGDDGGCFASALASVRTWGGVLEHPAGSHAFARHGLPQPAQASTSARYGSPRMVTELASGRGCSTRAITCRRRCAGTRAQARRK